MTNDKFSKSIGLVKTNKNLQIDSISPELLKQLWNVWTKQFWGNINQTADLAFQMDDFCEEVWGNFLNETIDTIPHYQVDWNDALHIEEAEIYQHIKKELFSCSWNRVYDFIQLCLDFTTRSDSAFLKATNAALESFSSGYRIVKNQVVPITNQQEIDSLTQTITETKDMSTVNTHFATALKHLSNRSNPDYPNSIKESICAVESLCKIITKKKNSTLSDALVILEKSKTLHPQLKAAFNSLYNYTSDSGGIRHGAKDGDVAPNFNEAKFMLVTCSAFINYLKSELSI